MTKTNQPSGGMIWASAGEAQFWLARRVFQTPSVPEQCHLQITCSGHYRLYVNGRFVERGPVRANPHRKYYDTVDLAAFLTPGENVLALKLVQLRQANTRSPHSRPMLWTSGPGPELCTDEGWRFRPDPAYDQNPARRHFNVGQGAMEIYDRRRAEEGWILAGYDDSAWSAARVLREPRSGSTRKVMPYQRLQPSPLPRLRQKCYRPSAILKTGEVLSLPWIPNRCDLGQYLLGDVPEELGRVRFEGLEGFCSGLPITVLPAPLVAEGTPEERRYDATVIFRFSPYRAGWLRLDVEGGAGAVIDVSYGENYIAGRVPAVLDVNAFADRYVLREGRQQHEFYDLKGMIYLQLTIRNHTRPVLLHAVEIAASEAPVATPVCHFGEEPLDRIARCCLETQRISLIDGMIDSFREQAEWLGDNSRILRLLYDVFNARPWAELFLRNVADSQANSGILPQTTLGDAGAWFIPDFMLWWVAGMRDHGRFCGPESLRPFFPELVRVLRWFEDQADERGFLNEVPNWIFIDWATVEKSGCSAFLVALHKYALDAAVEIAEALQYPNEAAHWRRQADLINNGFHSCFWDEPTRLYADNENGGQLGRGRSEHIQAMAVVAGLHRTDPSALLQRALTDTAVEPANTFIASVTLEALARAGQYEWAVDYLRRRWNPIADDQIGLLPEDFRLWRKHLDGQWENKVRSRCHGWSALPLSWLSREILGVRVERMDGPVVLAPQPGGLTQADGTVYTRHGPIAISWRIECGQMQIEVRLPAGVPYEKREPASLGGRCAWSIVQVQ